MGTNFYWKDGTHIGRRSAAGQYCWDCGVTLCKGGTSGVHHGWQPWHEECPHCGGRRKLDSVAALIELGFAKPRTERPKGVQSCSSFRWAQAPEVVRRSIKSVSTRRRPIRDEYGRSMTGGQFLRMIENNCPIQYADRLGQFS